MRFLTATERLQLLVLTLGLTSCGGGDSTFGNILDEESGGGTGDVTCTIDSTLPAAATVKVASTAGTNTSFGVAPNNATVCLVSWTLNGSTLAGTSAFRDINSALFNAGANTLVAIVSNGTSTASRTWTVTKNIPPSCASQTPAAGGNSINHTATLALDGTAVNTDGDTLSFAWKLNGGSAPSVFTGITSVGNNSNCVFDPAFANVGANQTVSVVFDDGLETASCSWTVSVTDPNTLAINACLPDDDSGTAGNQVILASTGGNSTESLIISDTGGVNYTWKINGSTVGGAAASTLTVSAASLAVGNHTVLGEVTDANNLPNPALSCSWTVKRNAPPVLTAQAPLAPSSPVAQKYRIGYTATQLFTATVSDGNSDAVTYTWKLDGVTQSSGSTAAPAGGATLSYNLAPGGATGLLGAHTLTLETTDSVETSNTFTWQIEINAFSTACNAILNGAVNTSSVQTNTPICTLAGSPGVGDGLDPTVVGQDKIRIIPGFFAEDSNGNLFISDYLNHAVWLYTVSGSAVTYGTAPASTVTFAANRLHLLVGGGANGVTVNNLAAKYSTKVDWPVSAAGTDYVRRGGGIAFDAASNNLYISDWGNDRIIRVDLSVASSNAVTVLGYVPGGGAAPINNAAGNTEGAAGTTHFCDMPAGITITDVGASRWLYVTCYNSNSIKRMNIDPTDATADADGIFGSTYTLNRLSATSTTFAGSTDGLLGTTGDMLVYNPYAIVSDANGNIYWTEWGRGRVRMATTAGSPMSVFSTRSTSNSYDIDNGAGTSTFTSNAAITYRDSTGLTPAAFKNVQAQYATSIAGSTAAFLVRGPTRIGTNACTPLQVTVRNNSSVAAPVTGNTTINLATNGAATSGFFSDSGCGSATGTVTVPAGSASAVFYYRTTAAEATRTITLSSAGYTNGTLSYTSQAVLASAATRFSVFAPGTFFYNDCVQIPVELMNASDQPATSATNTTVWLATRANGTFYSNATCTTPSSSITIAAGQIGGVIYYARKVEAVANGSASIVGRDDPNNFVAAATDTTPDIAETGSIGLRLPSGLAVKNHSGTGAVEEIYVSNERHHRVTFINATSGTLNRGGQTVEPGDGQSAIGTGANVFNGDNNQGNASAGDYTTLNIPSGLFFFNGELLIADMNYRIRSFAHAGNQRVTTLLGNGFGRLGFSTDSAVDAPDALMNAPSHLIVDSTAKIAYIADTYNGRIRRLNLVTGRFDTIVGNSFTGTVSGTDAPVENSSAISQKSSGYRAIGLYNVTAPSTNTFMLMAEHNLRGVGNTRASLIRAWNMSGPTTTLFGTSVSAGNVSTIAGDYSSGTKQWTAAPANADGAANSNFSNLLYEPEGITVTANRIFVANTNDCTIVELDPSNNSSKVVIGVSGTCTAGAADGVGTGAILRLPNTLTADTVSGNFLFADNRDQATAKIRYANFGAQVDVAGITVTAGGANAPQIQTLINHTLAGNQGQIWGLAVNSQFVCYGSGPGGGTYQATSAVAVSPGFDGSIGGHNVYCISRSDGSQSLRIGPSDSGSFPIRGGAPFSSTDQESVTASNVRMNTPVGLAFDHEGNLLIVEKGNGLVRLVRRWYN